MLRCLLFLFILLTLSAQRVFCQNWSPIGGSGKQYFKTFKSTEEGEEFFANRFDGMKVRGNDSLFFRKGNKPVLRGGHADRASDFVADTLIKTDSSYLLKATRVTIVHYESSPPYGYDTLDIDTFRYEFSKRFILDSIGLKIRTPLQEIEGIVVQLKDTTILGQSDSVAAIRYLISGLNLYVYLSKNQGLLSFQPLHLTNSYPVHRILEPSMIRKYDFHAGDRKKLVPGDEIHIRGYRYWGFLEALGNWQDNKTEYIYQILDTSLNSVLMRRVYFDEYESGPQLGPDHEFTYSDVVYQNDTVNNPAHIMNAVPMAGDFIQGDTSFYTRSLPTQITTRPFIHKFRRHDHYMSIWANHTNEVGFYIPDFHCPDLIDFETYDFDFPWDEYFRWHKEIVYSSIDQVEYGTKLIITSNAATTGRKEQQMIPVYPNPTTGKVYFPHLPSAIQNLNVWNTKGQLISLEIQSGPFAAFDASSLPPGLYQLRVSLEDGTTRTGKFVRK